LPARKSKENQGKKLAFPWISFAESGIFNGLQEKNEKIRRRPYSRPRLCVFATSRGERSKSLLFVHPRYTLLLQKSVPLISEFVNMKCNGPAGLRLSRCVHKGVPRSD
jgi:hypothetical protein